jgi:hypothetical protein
MRFNEAELADAERTIRDRLLTFYGTPDEVELWMCAPQPLLDFRSALQEIREGRAHEVERLIKQVEDGVYI